MTTEGMLYEIDMDTYEVTHLGSLGGNLGMALVTVPEPTTTVMVFGGLAVLMAGRKLR